jgi:hypothetical protein
MGAVKPELLSRYGLSQQTLLGRGMEAEAHVYDGQVLKVYSNDITVQKLKTLQEFYANLDGLRLSFQFPRINRIWLEDGVVMSLEKRLDGTPLSTQLAGLSEAELEVVFDGYVDAILELRNVTVPSFERYKLFDDEGLSFCSNGDFNAFLLCFLEHRLGACRQYLERDVEDLDGKLERLRTALSEPYTGEIALVHGDFFPANLLADEHNQISALLDFGWMTMYGDPLYDLATGWVFFDMYDDLKRNVTERLGQVIKARVGPETVGKLHRYVLLYSVFTAHAYAYEGGDGHYWWCVGNLNNPAYWVGLQ